MSDRKTKPPAPRESEVLRSVLKLLELLGIPAWRSNAGGGYRIGKGEKPQLIQGIPEGSPDIIGWLPKDGRFLGIEVKRPGEKPTAEQLAWLDRINGDGAVGFWCDDVGVCHAILARVVKGARVEILDGRCFLRDRDGDAS